MKKRYPIRNLKKHPGLPDTTWLYDHPGAFRMMPGHFPPNCTWCGSKLDIIDDLWRRCPQCDMRENDE